MRLYEYSSDQVVFHLFLKPHYPKRYHISFEEFLTICYMLQKNHGKPHARCASSSYKWRYGSTYKWLIASGYSFIRPLIGVIASGYPFIRPPYRGYTVTHWIPPIPGWTSRRGTCFHQQIPRPIHQSSMHNESSDRELSEDWTTAMLDTWNITLSETNIAPENRPSQKQTSFPTIHFQALCWFQGG